MPNLLLDDLQHRGPSSSEFILRQPGNCRPSCAARRRWLFVSTGAGAGLDSRRRAVTINKKFTSHFPPNPAHCLPPTSSIPSHCHPAHSPTTPHDRISQRDTPPVTYTTDLAVVVCECEREEEGVTEGVCERQSTCVCVWISAVLPVVTEPVSPRGLVCGIIPPVLPGAALDGSKSHQGSLEDITVVHPSIHPPAHFTHPSHLAHLSYLPAYLGLDRPTYLPPFPRSIHPPIPPSHSPQNQGGARPAAASKQARHHTLPIRWPPNPGYCSCHTLARPNIG